MFCIKRSSHFAPSWRWNHIIKSQKTSFVLSLNQKPFVLHVRCEIFGIVWGLFVYAGWLALIWQYLPEKIKHFLVLQDVCLLEKRISPNHRCWLTVGSMGDHVCRELLVGVECQVSFLVCFSMLGSTKMVIGGNWLPWFKLQVTPTPKPNSWNPRMVESKIFPIFICWVVKPQVFRGVTKTNSWSGWDDTPEASCSSETALIYFMVRLISVSWFSRIARGVIKIIERGFLSSGHYAGTSYFNHVKHIIMMMMWRYGMCNDWFTLPQTKHSPWKKWWQGRPSFPFGG